LNGRWKSLYRFTVVRDPYARFESFYWAQARHDREAWGDINRFVIEDLGHDEWSRDIHVTPQVLLVGGGMDFDFIGHTEDMEKVAVELSVVTGTQVVIPRLNRSKRQMPLSRAAKLRLRKLYARDFEEFGYA
jgi:hypothetical protein